MRRWPAAAPRWPTCLLLHPAGLHACCCTPLAYMPAAVPRWPTCLPLAGSMRQRPATLQGMQSSTVMYLAGHAGQHMYSCSPFIPLLTRRPPLPLPRRWSYMAAMVLDSPTVKWDGIVKFDLQAPKGEPWALYCAACLPCELSTLSRGPRCSCVQPHSGSCCPPRCMTCDAGALG